MPTFGTMRLAVPNSWDEFEDICKSSFSVRWSNPNLNRHGRQGQAQNGVDIYGSDSFFNFVGIQCKNTVTGITEKIIEGECLKAESFDPPITALYIATTAARDVNIQVFVRKLSKDRLSQSKFPIEVVFWEDIVSDLSKDPKAVRQHYPQLFGNLKPTTTQMMRDKDLTNLVNLLEVIDFSSTIQHLKWGAKYIHCSLLSQLNNILTIYQSPVFALNDPYLSNVTISLIKEWEQLMILVRESPYNYLSNQDTLSFIMPGDFCRNDEENELYEKISVQIDIFVCSINDFCSLIKNSYHEVDLNRTSAIARKFY